MKVYFETDRLISHDRYLPSAEKPEELKSALRKEPELLCE
jgi:hypothetical protein